MSSHAEKPWPRRIVICCDGTWQSSVTHQDHIASNVTKLARHLEPIGVDQHGNNWHQIVYYDSGIGTGSLSWFEKNRQGGLGDGLVENVIEAYSFIVLNHHHGDEIFCFGFSRGAYTARAVAGLVADIGVLEPSDMAFFPELYRGYMKNTEGKPFKNTQAWQDYEKKMSERDQKKRELLGSKAPASTKIDTTIKVKVVGVWDTVGSLGIPDGRISGNSELRTQHGFHNVKLTNNIEHAFQALALDERRKAFAPTLWYIPHKDVKSGNNLPELKQVWFPGFHINVGGGSDDGLNEMEGDMEGMANITFAWMLQCISPYLTISMNAFQNHIVDYQVWLKEASEKCTRHHPSQESYATRALHVATGAHANDTPVKIHPHNIDRGWGTGPMPDSLTGAMYTYAGEKVRQPGNCTVEVWEKEEDKYVEKLTKEVGVTNEYIHPVAAYRQFNLNNTPKQQTGWFKPKPVESGQEEKIPFEKMNHEIEDRSLLDNKHGAGKRYYWQKGDALLPEWIIMDDKPEQPNLERLWMKIGDGRVEHEVQWLNKLDALLK